MGFALAEDKTKDLVVVFYLLFLITVGLFLQTPQEIFYGLKEIFIAPGMLITDYMVVGGIGARWSTALVGLMVVLLKINKIDLNGISIRNLHHGRIRSVWENIWSVLPLFGVYIYSRGKPLKHIYTHTLWYLGTSGQQALLAMAGALLPHRRSCGWFCTAHWSIICLKRTQAIIFIISALPALWACCFLTSSERFYNSEIVVIWGQNSTALYADFSPMFVSMLLLGYLGKRPKKRLSRNIEAVRHFDNELCCSGGFANTLVNMGIVGLMGSVSGAGRRAL